MKRELIISILLTGLGLLGCGNPPGSPVINDLLVNDLLFNDSISKVAFFSIPADSITTIAIKDSIPSLTAGGSFSFTTDHGTFLISQGSSTLAAGSQSITIVSATDTAQVLLLSGLDATDSVLVTAGNGSTFTTGRLHFSMAYPDDLIFTSSRYRIKSNDSDNATISLTLLKALGKASNHVPVNFSFQCFSKDFIRFFAFNSTIRLITIC